MVKKAKKKAPPKPEVKPAEPTIPAAERARQRREFARKAALTRAVNQPEN
jgi:hypothetical protein